MSNKAIQINITTGELESVNIDPAIGFNVENLAADPASPASGRFFLNTTLNALRAYINSAWQQLVTTVTALGGDLTGTVINATVAKINGTAVSNTPTGPGLVLTSTSPSASSWQTPLGGGGSAVFVGARLSTSIQPVIPNITEVSISFDTVDYDTDTFFNSANPTRLTVPVGKAGKYLIVHQIGWNDNSNGQRFSYIRKNGTTQLGSANPNPNFARLTIGLTSEVVPLAVGDYIEIRASQDSGTTNTLRAGFGPYLTMVRLG